MTRSSPENDQLLTPVGPSSSPQAILWLDRRLASPWVLAVWAALAEKRIAFRAMPLDLLIGEQRRPEHLARSLTGKVPTLEHDGVAISESLAIIEYLDEAFPLPSHPAYLPTSRLERARTRQIMAWVRSDLFELRRCLPFEGLFDASVSTDWSAAAAREADALVRVCAARIAEGAIGQPAPGDFDLGFSLRRLLHYGVDHPGLADVTPLAEAIWSRPSVRSWVEHRRPLAEPETVPPRSA